MTLLKQLQAGALYVLRPVGAFLGQWVENINFICHEYLREGGFDGVNFPLTADPYGPWALLPKSKRARKIMRGMRRVMGPMQCYAFLRQNSHQLGFVGLGGLPGPRNLDDARIALGEADAQFWWEEHQAKEKFRKEHGLNSPAGV